MEFEDFLKKLGKNYDPDRAYKLYLQTQIAIIQEILVSGKLITRESLDSIENKVFNKIIEKTEK